MYRLIKTEGKKFPAKKNHGTTPRFLFTRIEARFKGRVAREDDAADVLT